MQAILAVVDAQPRSNANLIFAILKAVILPHCRIILII